MIEARIAHASAPRVDPANSAFRRPGAIGRIVRSTMLLSISTRPSVRNTVNPFQWLSVYLIAFARSDFCRLLSEALHQPNLESLEDRFCLGLSDNATLGGRPTTNPFLDLIHHPYPLQRLGRHRRLRLLVNLKELPAGGRQTV